MVEVAARAARDDTLRLFFIRMIENAVGVVFYAVQLVRGLDVEGEFSHPALVQANRQKKVSVFVGPQPVDGPLNRGLLVVVVVFNESETEVLLDSQHCARDMRAVFLAGESFQLISDIAFILHEKNKARILHEVLEMVGFVLFVALVVAFCELVGEAVFKLELLAGR